MIAELQSSRFLRLNAKIAAHRTGEVHMASLPLKFIARQSGIAGSWTQATGKYQPQIVYFGGNFWAKRAYNYQGEGNIPPATG